MRHFLTVSCAIVCFCVCGALWAQGPGKKTAPSAPATKKHPAQPTKVAGKLKTGKHPNMTNAAHEKKLNADQKELDADRQQYS